jgi:hypothetical protein
MARWGGEADAAAEAAGGGGGKFPPAPRGIYTIQVADYKDGQTQETKRNKVDLECEIAEEGEHFGKKVWVTVTQIPKGQNGHGIMVHQLHAFGLALDGNYDFDTADLQGRQARALLGVAPKEKVKDGKTYVNDTNFVEEVYTDKHPEPKADELPPQRQAPWEKGAKKAPAAAAARPANSSAQPPAAARRPRQEEVPF